MVGLRSYRGALFAALSATTIVFGLFAGAADAQDAPAVTTAVEGGTTEATFEAPADAPPVEPEEPKAEVDWAISAGGSINTGNTEAWTLNAGSGFKLVKTDNTLTADALFNFGRANLADPAPPAPPTSYSTTVKKFLFSMRYDYFLSEKDALWMSVVERWDPFAGFDTQFMAQAGYLRAFVKEENHYLAGRIGYAYTYELFSSLSPMFATASSNHIHGLLAALDYENKLNEHVSVISNLTTIYNLNTVEEQGASAFEDIRISYSLALLASLTEKLSAEVRFLLLYDRIPPTTKKTDTTTLFSLVYTLL